MHFADVRPRATVTVDLPSGASPVASDAEEEEDDYRDSVASAPPVEDWTLIHLVNFIYDKNPESCPLSSLPLTLRCSFESLYAVSDS